MFVGCMGGITWTVAPASFVGGLNFGLVVMLIIQCYGTVSGAHLNPSVTLCAILYRSLSVSVRFGTAFFLCRFLNRFLFYI